MPTSPTPRVALTPESAVLERALGVTGERSYRVSDGTNAADVAVRDLVTSLAGRGWRSSSAARLLVASSSHGLHADLGGADAPPVVAVQHDTTPTNRPWPGWHDEVLDAGYTGCLHTTAWSLYVAQAEASTLGPALCYPATDEERWPDAIPTASRAALVDEIVFWRTAALTRWARRAGEEPERTNKDLLHEIAHARHLLDATQSTLSWRITEPLRRVQAARLRGGRR